MERSAAKIMEIEMEKEAGIASLEQQQQQQQQQRWRWRFIDIRFFVLKFWNKWMEIWDGSLWNVIDVLWNVRVWCWSTNLPHPKRTPLPEKKGLIKGLLTIGFP